MSGVSWKAAAWLMAGAIGGLSLSRVYSQLFSGGDEENRRNTASEEHARKQVEQTLEPEADTRRSRRDSVFSRLFKYGHTRQASIAGPTVTQQSLLKSIQKVFNAIDTNSRGVITSDDLIRFLHSLGLNAERTTQVLNVMQVGSAEKPVTFGEFFKGIISTLDPSHHEANKQQQRQHPVYVFLGGACGKTTWRTDIATPILEAFGVTYYNPQVENWNPHLVIIENLMKAASSKLLFVIDGSTPSIASMIEAAQYIAEGRDVCLVLDEVKKGLIIDGERLSDRSVNDLNRGRRYLAGVAELHHVKVFNNIPIAIQSLVDSTTGSRNQREQEDRTHHSLHEALE